MVHLGLDINGFLTVRAGTIYGRAQTLGLLEICPCMFQITLTAPEWSVHTHSFSSILRAHSLLEAFATPETVLLEYVCAI